MTFKQAYEIFKNLESTEYTGLQKSIAIKMVMNAPTHNGVTKDDLVNAVKFIWHLFFVLADDETITSVNDFADRLLTIGENSNKYSVDGKVCGLSTDTFEKTMLAAAAIISSIYSQEEEK